jgi:hypothetical protein
MTPREIRTRLPFQPEYCGLVVSKISSVHQSRTNARFRQKTVLGKRFIEPTLEAIDRGPNTVPRCLGGISKDPMDKLDGCYNFDTAADEIEPIITQNPPTCNKKPLRVYYVQTRASANRAPSHYAMLRKRGVVIY